MICFANNAIAVFTPSVFSGSVPGYNRIVVFSCLVESSIKNSWCKSEITIDGNNAVKLSLSTKIVWTLIKIGSFWKIGLNSFLKSFRLILWLNTMCGIKRNAKL